MDECGINTNQKEDGPNGGELTVVPKGENVDRVHVVRRTSMLQHLDSKILIAMPRCVLSVLLKSVVTDKIPSNCFQWRGRDHRTCLC
jgi:hypothetical protein